MKNKTNFFKVPVSRIIALLILDVMAILVASFMAIFLRFEFKFSDIPQEYWKAYTKILPFTIMLTLVFFVIWKLYRSVWRYASAVEMVNIAMATVCAAVAQTILCNATHNLMPRSYYLLYWFFLFALTCGIRFSYRILRIFNMKRRSIGRNASRTNVMIIGAGAAANAIMKEIEASQYISLSVKCFVDDNPGCHGKFLRGVPIVGGRDKIMDAVGQYAIDEIIFAIPTASRLQRKEIIDICKETGCKLRTLPGMYQLINGEVSVSKLKDVEIEDLLGREPIKINIDDIIGYVSGKVVMVTGGGGSIGSELCRQIAGHNPKQLIIVDIYENNAYEIQQELIRKYPELNLKGQRSISSK